MFFRKPEEGAIETGVTKPDGTPKYFKPHNFTLEPVRSFTGRSEYILYILRLLFCPDTGAGLRQYVREMGQHIYEDRKAAGWNDDAAALSAIDRMLSRLNSCGLENGLGDQLWEFVDVISRYFQPHQIATALPYTQYCPDCRKCFWRVPLGDNSAVQQMLNMNQCPLCHGELHIIPNRPDV